MFAPDAFLILSFGVTVYAVSTVLMVFMAGLASSAASAAASRRPTMS
jgi:hypothetical protein